jgi:hypothetical protein
MESRHAADTVKPTLLDPKAEIERMSAYQGPKRTNRTALEMSVEWGSPEVAGRGAERCDRPIPEVQPVLFGVYRSTLRVASVVLRNLQTVQRKPSMNPQAKRLFLILLTVVAAVFLGWAIKASVFVHDRAVRSRLTLAVETPDGVRTGSSVTEHTTTFGPFQLKMGSSNWSIGSFLSGEGVVVDLGNRGLLVATLVKPSWLSSRGWGAGGGYAGVWPFSQSEYSGNPAAGSSDAEKYMVYLDELKRVKPKADISLKDVPVLVRFSDPSNPASMSLVDPFNLADAFGPGVRLQSATVEISSDPITRSIDARLPWLKLSRQPKFDDYIFPLPPPGFERDKSLPPNFRYSAFSKAE